MTNNPELRRHAWLELTAHRLIAMPAILLLAFVAVHSAYREAPADAVAWVALGGFGLLTVIWGSGRVSASVIDEIADKTWDWQRLSTISPWTMTWGKLLGATLFAWFGGAVCLLAFVVFAAAPQFPQPLLTVATLVGVAVLMHAATLAATLHVAARDLTRYRRSFGLLVLLLALWLLSATVAMYRQADGDVAWFGWAIPGPAFVLASIGVFALWAVVGAHRAMCVRLAVPTTPAGWIGFVLTLTVYTAGLPAAAADGEHALALARSGLVCSAALTYVMLFTEATGPATWRRVLRRWELRQWRRLAQELPCWPLTWALAALSAAALALAGDVGRPGALSAATAGALVALVLRDAALLMLFASSPRPGRAEATTLVYLLVLYVILPGLLEALQLPGLAAIVLPLGKGDAAVSLGIAALQAGLAGALALRRLQGAMRPRQPAG